MSSGTLAPEGVREMFDRVSPVYDLMNRLTTMGLDGGWRRRAVASVVRPGDAVLDACCGTGDLAIAADRAGGVVTGLDFSERMLDRARRKSQSVTWVHGDVTALPFEDASFDAVTIGFGIRNVPDLEAGLAELARVLEPGGRLACLDLTRPEGLLAPFYRLWFDRLIPLAGKALPGGEAYTYLPASVRRFESAQALAEAIARAGLAEIRWRLMAGGIVALHTARRPG
jgi:demethylmenaquinone methyltransferase / 2-methoxy-6-polyprenyl-1,4-benzoquinol methylase